jgi:hypothetical protein
MVLQEVQGSGVALETKLALKNSEHPGDLETQNSLLIPLEEVAEWAVMTIRKRVVPLSPVYLRGTVSLLFVVLHTTLHCVRAHLQAP